MSTVASVAIRQAKHFIMIELSPDYYNRAQKRIALEKQQMDIFRDTIAPTFDVIEPQKDRLET